jgi:hypothetical protein
VISRGALADGDRGEDVGVAGELGRGDVWVPVEDLQAPRAAGELAEPFRPGAAGVAACQVGQLIAREHVWIDAGAAIAQLTSEAGTRPLAERFHRVLQPAGRRLEASPRARQRSIRALHPSQTVTRRTVA